MAVVTSAADNSLANGTSSATSGIISSGPSPSSTGGGTTGFLNLFSNSALDARRLQIANAFKRQLGPVVLSSGMAGNCPVSHCRLDWAMIDVTSAFATAAPSNVSTSFPAEYILCSPPPHQPQAGARSLPLRNTN